MGKLEDNKEKMLDLFYNHYYSMSMIAKELKVSRQAVQQIFKQWKVETATSQAAWVEVTCAQCLRKYKVPRSRAREKKENNKLFYCEPACYQKYYNKQMKQTD